MISKPVARAVAVTTLVTLGSLLASACGTGQSGGGGQTNYVTGADGVATVTKGDRKPVGQIKGKTLQGKKFDIADYRGKVVVINVWGSWCPPCRAEAPYLNKVAKATKGEGVEFVGINTRDGSESLAEAFESDFNISYPSLYDPTGKIIMAGFPKDTVNLQGLPVTIALDKSGKIASRFFGGINDEQLHAMIDPLIEDG